MQHTSRAGVICLRGKPSMRQHQSSNWWQQGGVQQRSDPTAALTWCRRGQRCWRLGGCDCSSKAMVCFAATVFAAAFSATCAEMQPVTLAGSRCLDAAVHMLIK